MEITKDKWIITFNGNQVRVSGRNLDERYLVKWFCDDEFVGEYD